MRTTPMRRVKQTLLAAMTGVTLGIHACQPATDSSDTEAITNRPQNYDRFIAILKLKNPALLSTATKLDGKLIIDENLKKQILAEQQAAITELKNLSPDIAVLYSYKLTLNGLAVISPRSVEAKFRKLSSVAYVERETPFTRLTPVAVQANSLTAQSEDGGFGERTSVNFIGSSHVHNDLGVTGRGITVGVIDTGIDYTHKMFGGAGTEDAFKNNNPDEPSDDLYPNAKVVGGIDLVGTAYNAASPVFDHHIPKADDDPIDEGGHGTHVAGTIAGIGDGLNTYSGVAPDAALHAIKVFGKNGSTGDAVIIAALEYAADPDKDLDINDRLDVVNLSLGSSFGTPHVLYSEAVDNLIKGGTAVVASAGNSGPHDYIVGSPSTSTEAISVAATIDDMDHNWKFRAVAFSMPSRPDILAEAIEGATTKPIAEAGDVSGKLVYIGLADRDLTEAEKASVQGNIALIDRGIVTFGEKLQRAANAGATGVVMANNAEGQPIRMGGDGMLEIPGIMITKALGDILKAGLAQSSVEVAFSTPHRVEKPELIDTLTGFSSRGPRSMDGALKPEISAPGASIVSAAMGKGAEGVKMSGTSMAAPHIAGVVALLRQAHPELPVPHLKSMLMTTAKQIYSQEQTPYDVAYMGAGRVQALDAVKATLIAEPNALSLGEVLVETSKLMRTQIKLSNLSDKSVTYELSTQLDQGLTIEIPSSVSLKPHESKSIEAQVRITAPVTEAASLELDGFIILSSNEQTHKIPVLAVVNRTTRIDVEGVKVYATSPADDVGSAAEVRLQNNGATSGSALIFNLLGKDERKESARENSARNGICDLESAGYRVIRKDIQDQTLDLLQIAVKLYNPVTTWHVCEVSVLIDQNADGIPDQELLGTNLQSLTGNAADVNNFASVLTSADLMRSIRTTFEQSFPDVSSAVYTPAIVDQQDISAFAHSTVAVISVDLAKLARTAQGDIRLKVATLTETSSPEGDDFLGNELKWATITPTADGMAYIAMPESITLAAGEESVIPLVKGAARGNLVVYLPHNKSTASPVQRDQQAKILKATYGH